MKLVKKIDYNSVSRLFKNLRHIPSISSILCGNKTAKIYVNSAINPTSGFIWTKWGEFFVAGDARNKRFNSSLKLLLENDLFFISHQLGETTPNIYYNEEPWGKTIEVLFASKSPIQVVKQGYRFSMEKYEPSGFGKLGNKSSIIPLTEKMLKNVSNSHEVWQDIEQNWSSRTRFEKKAWGFGVIHNNMIKAMCYPKLCGERDCELKFRSFVHHVNPDIMSKAVEATVLFGQNSGYEMIWTAWNWDRKNIAFAKRVGFQFAFSMPAFFVVIDPILTHSSSANYHFGKGDYLRANFHLNRVLELGDRAGEWLFLRGCCRAVLDNKEAAINDLDNAIKHGFTAIDRMKKQNELIVLHSLPEWQTLTDNH